MPGGAESNPSFCKLSRARHKAPAALSALTTAGLWLAVFWHRSGNHPSFSPLPSGAARLARQDLPPPAASRSALLLGPAAAPHSHFRAQTEHEQPALGLAFESVDHWRLTVPRGRVDSEDTQAQEALSLLPCPRATSISLSMQRTHREDASWRTSLPPAVPVGRPRPASATWLLLCSSLYEGVPATPFRCHSLQRGSSQTGRSGPPPKKLCRAAAISG